VGSDPTSSLPAGPWALVLGMHRSGTSAITGALAGLGLRTPPAGDRMDWPESNPEHWESLSMTVFDDDLMETLGGSWREPPDLPSGWESGPQVRPVADAVQALSTTFAGSGPVVWKDPRLCLLLPYWQRIVPPPVAAVLIWRAPMAVARSLEQRDAMPLLDGVALWERYNRSALANLAGIDTFVCSFESVKEDPTNTIGALMEWLSSLPQYRPLAPSWNLDRAVAGISHAPTRDRASHDDLLPPQVELVNHLTGLDGGHTPLPHVPLAPESPWTAALLAARRENHSYRIEGLETELGYASTELDRLRNSTSWRITRPLRAVVSAVQARNVR
jgi:hypothetical protein